MKFIKGKCNKKCESYEKIFFYINIGHTIGYKMPDIRGTGKWKDYFVKLG